MSAEKLLDAILRREGGYVDHPADRGGPTNRGITLGTLKRWRETDVTVDDLKALTVDEAKQIYWQEYVVEPGFLAVEDGKLRELLVDMAVNHGPGGAVQMLQRACGVAADGIVGEVTLDAMSGMDPKRLYVCVCAERARTYGRIISGDKQLTRAQAAGLRLQAEFASGWMNRLAEFIEEAC